MVHHTARYTRFVYLVKTILPLIAIGLLATVFLFTKERTLEGGLEFSKADFVALESGMRVTKPRFSGSNADGDVYYFSAELLLPDAPAPTKLLASGLSGEIRLFDGLTIEIAAKEAEIDLETRNIRLFEGTDLTFSNGLRARSDKIFADMDAGTLTSSGPIRATSPMGEIEAGNLRITTVRQGAEENRMIWFENGVRLTFTVQETPENEAPTE